MSFSAFDVVRVPFPFTDRQSVKRRPAVVLSGDAVFNSPAGHSVMAMITSKGHAPWPLDCAVEDLESAGLPAPSIVRFKLFTLDNRLIMSKIGALSESDKVRVSSNLHQLLSENGEPVQGSGGSKGSSTSG